MKLNFSKIVQHIKCSSIWLLVEVYRPTRKTAKKVLGVGCCAKKIGQKVVVFYQFG